MNRERFEMHDLYRKFFDRVVREAIDRKLASPDHFTIDGTLLHSLASHKSLQQIESPGNAASVQGLKNNNRKKDRHDDGDARARGAVSRRIALVDWCGVKSSNTTHRSTTDPEARLARGGKGRETHLCHSGHVLMENRSGLCFNITADYADSPDHSWWSGNSTERRRTRRSMPNDQR